MAITAQVLSELGCRFGVLLPHLNERQRRLAVAVEARLLGHGGVRTVAQAAGMSETTVRRGMAELEAGEDPFLDGPGPCTGWWPPAGRGQRSCGAAGSAGHGRAG